MQSDHNPRTTFSPPLHGCRVLDLADEQGSFCSRLLALLGATVIRPETPGERPSSHFYNNSNKLLLPIDPRSCQGKEKLHNLVAGSDVLIETCRFSDLESLGLTRRRLRHTNPRLVHLSITPFGRSGPRRDYRSCDSVAAAFGGQMYVTGRSRGVPLKLFGEQSYYTASLFGAVAVLLRLIKRDMTGKGSYIDLSVQEAVASTLDHVLVDYFQDGTIAGRGDNNRSGDFALLPSSDGHVLITILRNWDTLLELMAAEGLAGKLLEEEFRQPEYREQHTEEIFETVSSWTSRHTKRELFELGQSLRFPWASVDTPDEVLRSPQLDSRKLFVHIPLFEGGPSAAMPGLPFRFSSFALPEPLPSAQLPDEFTWNEVESHPGGLDMKERSDEKILEGMRVLDLTRMLSGPYATRILADFGAEVIKIQSRKTAQGAERNDAAYFAAWNRNKRSITLDLDNPDAKEDFLRLAAESSVVVENYSPRVMANWGLDYERLRAVNSKIVMVSISAMGRSGPWRDFVGFAPTFHALSGLISATSRSLAPPAGIGYAYSDVVAGLYAALATLSAIRCRDKAGKGQHVDLSAYEAMCTFLEPAPFDSRVGFHIYRCTGEDRWCVVSVKDDIQANLVESLAGGFESRMPEDIVHQLQNAGIAAGVVQNASDLAHDEQLKARHFFVSLDHPTIGKVISDRTALWDWRQRPKHWQASPLLGEHNNRFEIPD